MLNDSQSNWCPEVYRSIFVDHYNHDHVRVAPCCQSTSAIEPIANFDFTTSKYLNNLREKFSLGEKPAACARCWEAEDLGNESRRQGAIKFFKLNEPTDQIILESIDHSSTWACNSACVMCNPTLSSMWATELNLSRDDLAAIGRSFQKKNTFFDNLDLGNIKKIHFNGGEPMLNNDQIKLLEQVDLSNTTVSYNTNGTVYPDHKIIDIWKKSKLVKLFFSIDATEAAFEYIRYPGKWESVVSNILTMKQQLPSNVMFGFNVTVGSYNLLELSAVYQWFADNILTNRENDPSDFCWQLAYNYNVNLLPQYIKQQAIQELKSIEQYQGLVNLLEDTNSTVDDTWIKKLTTIDQRRQTDWKKSLRIGKYY